MPTKPTKNLIMSRELIRESNLIEGFDNPLMDADAWTTCVWLKGSLRLPLNDRVIQKLNSRLTERQPELNDWRGTYRSRSRVKVTVAGQPTADPAQVDRLMEEWIENWYRLDPKESHIQFEKIHPFIDGNGRTGRMLMWARQSMLGQPLTQITRKNVAEYYDWFK